MVTMVALGLAAVPFLASCILGAVAVFGRRVRVGEYIELDSRVGRVVDVSLLNISLEDDGGMETRVPHFAWLLKPMRVLGPAPRVTVSLSVSREHATVGVRTRLTDAITHLGSDPRVDFESVTPAGAVFSLSVCSEELDARSLLFVAALEALDRSNGEPPRGR